MWKGDAAKPARMAFGDLTKAKDVELAKLLQPQSDGPNDGLTEQACHRGKEMAAALKMPMDWPSPTFPGSLQNWTVQAW